MPPIQAKRTIEAVSIILGLVPLQKSYEWDDMESFTRPILHPQRHILRTAGHGR